MLKINVLGTEYKVFYKTNKQDKKLEKVDGYCDVSIKKIVVIKRTKFDIMDLSNLQYIINRVLRHEIIHAFLFESGLWCNSHDITQWGMDEEMTDWFAMQSPKIFEIYKKLNILE